jgi:hypothetical protein
MSDEPVCAQNNPQPEPLERLERPVINGVTRQAESMARILDRLPPGTYVVELEKSTRLETWRAVVTDLDGQLVRSVELER